MCSYSLVKSTSISLLSQTYDEAIVTAEQQYASLGESADMTPLINFMKVAISKYEAASQKEYVLFEMLS